MENGVFIHPTSIVDTQQIGRGTRIWAFTHVLRDTSIGDCCNIGDHCFIESGVRMGNNVTIKNGNNLWEGVTLDDGVFVGPGVFFTNDLYPRSPRLPQAQARYSTRQWLVATHIEEGVSIGAGAIILAGTVIGKFAMIGAGAVVTRNVPAYALVIGNPARLHSWVCQCGQPLIFQEQCGHCPACNRRYSKHNETVNLC